MKFSTKDKHHSPVSHNCAERYDGAWWYRDCHRSNLNGLYHSSGAITTFANGIDWKTWRGHYYSLKFTEMKVRPK